MEQDLEERLAKIEKDIHAIKSSLVTLAFAIEDGVITGLVQSVHSAFQDKK